MPRVTIVVPCYNEAERLPVERFRAGLRELGDVGFVFVDDGSTDDTPALLRLLRDAGPERVHVLELRKNAGKGAAVRAGVLQALELCPQYVGYWDADLATPLETIRDFCDLLDTRPDIEMVFGARVQLLGRAIRRSETRHYLGRVFATAVSNLLRLKIYDTQCGAKLFRGTAELGELFREPFLTRWMFDVELVARLIRARRGTTLPQAQHVIYEYPLTTWTDVRGSKVRVLDVLRTPGGLLRIYRGYLTPRS